MTSRRGLLSLLALAGFLSGVLLSPLPQFHRHANELAELCTSTHASRAPEIESSGERRQPSSGECPACVIFGLSALTAFGPGASLAATPALHLAILPPVAVVSRAGSPSRGRAPPLS